MKRKDFDKKLESSDPAFTAGYKKGLRAGKKKVYGEIFERLLNPLDDSTEKFYKMTTRGIVHALIDDYKSRLGIVKKKRNKKESKP